MGGRLGRTLRRDQIEERLDALIRRQGEAAVNRLRDNARAIAPQLGLESEFAALDKLIGALLGTRKAEAKSSLAKARMAGSPFDPDRVRLFEAVFAALRDTVPVDGPATEQTSAARATLSFFDAYFSNFIEGTDFSVEEAERIVFEGVIPQERPDDAHDVLGTYRIVSDLMEMQRLAEFRRFSRAATPPPRHVHGGTPGQESGDLQDAVKSRRYHDLRCTGSGERHIGTRIRISEWSECTFSPSARLRLPQGVTAEVDVSAG